MTKKIKILIVDDEALFCLGLKMYLEKQGHILCKTATTSKDAIDIFKNCKMHLIIMDIQLANGPDGIETAKIIKGIGDVPIIFTTGFDFDDVKEKMNSVKHEGFMTKPINKIELLEKIKKSNIF